MRLNQFLAAAGLGSRRSVEELIRIGAVWVNHGPGMLSTRVDPVGDVVKVDGRRVLLPAQHTHLLLNKPPGYTVTRGDRHAGRSVYELLPGRYRNVAYVGRLDRDSEGLLLFTTDGQLAHRLTLPSFEIERQYQVVVDRRLKSGELALLCRGIVLPDGLRVSARAASYTAFAGGGGTLLVTLCEGKKREVRRMCSFFGLLVRRLRRVRSA